MKKVLAALVGMAMAFTFVGAMGASAATTVCRVHPVTVHPVTAVVVNRAGMVPEGVSVTLTAILTRSIPKGALYTWDFTNDGVFESPLRRTPDLTHVYRGAMPGSTVTATIAVYFPGTFPGSPAKYRDSVTFSLRVPFLGHRGPALHQHHPVLHS